MLILPKKSGQEGKEIIMLNKTVDFEMLVVPDTPKVDRLTFA